MQRCTANVETPTSYDIEPYNVSEIQHTYTPTVELDQFEPSMYFFQDARLRASQDIFFVISYFTTLLLFKHYLTELDTLKDAILILAAKQSELNIV